MTPQAAEPSLFDAIADLLPATQREHFYRRMAHLRQLSPNDEMLQIAEAMGFLALVTRDTPAAIAAERQQFEAVLQKTAAALQTAHKNAVVYQQQLEERLTKLPQEIATGISPEVIAIKITESIRQRWSETGMPDTADTIKLHAATLSSASREFTAALRVFADSREGAVPQVSRALAHMNANLENAADHIRAQMSGLGKELWRTISVLCGGSLVLGMLLGMMFERWLAGG